MSTLFGCFLAVLAGQAFGTNTLPDPEGVSRELDAAVEAKWETRGIVPAAIAEDATFLRRAWLALAGHVPSPLVVRPFLDDARSDKRARLVDELLAGGASHIFGKPFSLAEVVRVLLQMVSDLRSQVA